MFLVTHSDIWRLRQWRKAKVPDLISCSSQEADAGQSLA